MTEYGRNDRLPFETKNHGKHNFLSVHYLLCRPQKINSFARQTPRLSAFGSHCGWRQQCLLWEVASTAI